LVRIAQGSSRKARGTGGEQSQSLPWLRLPRSSKAAYHHYPKHAFPCACLYAMTACSLTTPTSPASSPDRSKSSPSWLNARLTCSTVFFVAKPWVRPSAGDEVGIFNRLSGVASPPARVPCAMPWATTAARGALIPACFHPILISQKRRLSYQAYCSTGSKHLYFYLKRRIWPLNNSGGVAHRRRAMTFWGA
jgi:hypothetical protein